MHKFLKLGLLPVVFIACSSLFSCNALKKEVALITDVGDIDDGSFNQASWEAIKEYCENKEHPHTYDYYRPFADSDYARRCAIKQAVYKGAQVVVCPGFKFAYTVGVCQTEFPNTHFVLLDASTHQNDEAQTPIPVAKNTVCVCFKSEISGYLAGYAIAYDYLETDLQSSSRRLKDKYGYGFVGGDNAPGVYPYGFGFIQGVATATANFCKDHQYGIEYYPNIEIRYNYAKAYAQSDPAAVMVKSWYDSDIVKAVFACGGKLYQSITEGVKDYNRKNNFYDFEEGNAPREAARWVGVDSDQYLGLKDAHEKKTIITSALKGLSEAINTAIGYHYQGVWDDAIGGAVAYNPDGTERDREWILGLHSEFGRPDEQTPKRYEVIKKNYVGIPEATKDGSDDPNAVLRGFTKFTKGQYDNGIAQLGNNDDFVYNGDGKNLYHHDETDFPTPEGTPAFMNFDEKSDDPNMKINGRWTYEYGPYGSRKFMTFREKYLGGYPAHLLRIISVD